MKVKDIKVGETYHCHEPGQPSYQTFDMVVKAVGGWRRSSGYEQATNSKIGAFVEDSRPEFKNNILLVHPKSRHMVLALPKDVLMEIGEFETQEAANRVALEEAVEERARINAAMRQRRKSILDNLLALGWNPSEFERDHFLTNLSEKQEVPLSLIEVLAEYAFKVTNANGHMLAGVPRAG